jgi:hypothetical protein
VLDQPTRMSSAAKSRVARHANLNVQGRVSVVLGNGRASTSFYASSKNLPGGDNARGNEHELDQHGDDRRKSEAYTFCLPRSNTMRPFHLSPVSRRGIPPVPLTVRVRDRSSWAHCGVHLSCPAVTLFPPTFPVRSRLALRLENPLDAPLCGLSLPEPTRARRSYLCPSPRQRSTRSRLTGSTSTVGDTSIDWIVPDSTIPYASKVSATR